MSKIGELIEVLSRNKGAKFCSFVYKNEQKEVARVTLILGATTEALYEKDIALLEEMKHGVAGMHLMCVEELLASRKQSMEKGIGQNDDYTLKDVYVYPVGLEHVGIRVHKEDGSLQVRGLAMNKVVLVPGEYGPDTRRAKTKIKDSIRAKLPSHRFRTYRLDRIG